MSGGSVAGPRVLFVSHTGHPGGAERVLLTVATRLAERCEVLLLTDGPLRGLLTARGVRCNAPATGPDLSAIRRDAPLAVAVLRAARGLAAVVRRVAAASREVDVLYANSQKAFVVSGLVALFARRTLVWHLHDILDREHFGGPQIRVVVLLANRRAAAVVVPSAAAGAAFVAAGGRADLVRVVPNGIDTGEVADAAHAGGRARRRAELGLPPGPVVGVFSRLAPWKGQHVALDAVARLPEVHCLVVGGPQFGEDAYLDRLHDQVAELGIDDRVTFAGHRDDVPSLLGVVDLCVHPSVMAEPFGLTVVEAMAAGLPVVAAANGALPEIVSDGVDGVLVEPGDAAALATAVEALLTDPERARRLGAAARHTATTSFSGAALAAGVDQVLREVAGTLAVPVGPTEVRAR